MITLNQARERLEKLPSNEQQEIYRKIFTMANGPCTHNGGGNLKQICPACCTARDQALVEVMTPRLVVDNG